VPETSLCRVDRTRTPWLIVAFHAPVYNTYTAHYKENECMRQVGRARMQPLPVLPICTCPVKPAVPDAADFRLRAS
jgi:hypothetical protein